METHDRLAERLAGEAACSVYRCPCGCLQVHIGSTTVRLSDDSLRELSRVLHQALRVLGMDEALAVRPS